MVNLKLRFRLPKIWPFNKQLGLVWTKTSPSQRLFHFLFYFKRLPQILMAKIKKFPFFCKILISNAQNENCLSIWLCFSRKRYIEHDGHEQKQFFKKKFDASFRLQWRQIIVLKNGERLIKTKDNEILKWKSTVKRIDKF